MKNFSKNNYSKKNRKQDKIFNESNSYSKNANSSRKINRFTINAAKNQEANNFKNSHPIRASNPVALEYIVGSKDFGNLFVLFLARLIRSNSFEFNKCSI